MESDFICTVKRRVPKWINARREKYPRSWERWTPEEDAFLLELKAAGREEEAPALLKRGQGSITMRLKRIYKDDNSYYFPHANPHLPETYPGEIKTTDPDQEKLQNAASELGMEADLLTKALDCLSLDLWLVFSMRSGILDSCARTIQNIAEYLGKSAEEIAIAEYHAVSAIKQAASFLKCAKA